MYRYRPNLGRFIRGTPQYTNLNAKGGVLFLVVPAWNEKLVQSIAYATSLLICSSLSCSGSGVKFCRNASICEPNSQLENHHFLITTIPQ